MALPETVERILNAALVCEFTVVDRNSRPVTHPMIPLYDGEKIYLTSSVLFSRKLEYIRQNPKVSISVSDPIGTPVDNFDRITVQGDAELHEGDLHKDWERLLPLWLAKEPGVAFFLSKRVALPLFWERTVIEITPRKAYLWPEGDTSHKPEVYELVGAS